MSVPAFSFDDVRRIPTSPSNEAEHRVADDPKSGVVASSHSVASPAFFRLWREPLLQFCVLGAIIFGADAVLHPPAKDDRVIVVTKAMRQSIIDNFDEDKERVPSEQELKTRIDSWVANEILYREGKKLAVDRGDETIRDRITYKLQVLINDQIQVPKPTEDQLRAWFAANHARFDEPERVGFYLTQPSDEATARRELEDIQAQRETVDLQRQTRAILGRPVDSLAASFGEGFRDALLALPLGQWTVLQSKDGWHVVRLDSRRAGVLASLDGLREEVASNWTAEETRKRAWEAVNRLKASYDVRYEQ
jgi:parvulin-like peptidyl-prolyl isomerase